MRLPGSVNLRRIALVIGISAVTVAPVVLHEPFIIPTVSIGAAFSLFSTLGAEPIFPGRLATILEWIGARSYSIYLCHLSVIYALRKTLLTIFHFVNPAPIPLFVGAWALLIIGTFLAADMSYRFIEQPAIRRFSSRTGFRVAQ